MHLILRCRFGYNLHQIYVLLMFENGLTPMLTLAYFCNNNESSKIVSSGISPV